MFDAPELDKTITVTTDHGYHYGETTHTGKVVVSDEIDEPGTFRLFTGQKHWPVSTIALNRVVALIYLDGTEAAQHEVKVAETVETWAVEGSKGDIYQVTRNDELWSCDCKGFGFRRTCKHITNTKSDWLEERVLKET